MNKPILFAAKPYTSISNLRAGWSRLQGMCGCIVLVVVPRMGFVGSDNDNAFDHHKNHSIYSKLLVLLLSFTITVVAIIMVTIKILLLQVEEFEKYSHASHIGAFDLIH